MDVEAFIAKHKFGDMVASRIRKAYPDGKIKPYEILRGWHPSHSFRQCINMDVMPVSRFIEKYGRDAYRAIPKNAFVKNGKRKALTRRYIESRAWE